MFGKKVIEKTKEEKAKYAQRLAGRTAICPQCKITMTLTGRFYRMVGDVVKCNNCGYEKPKDA